MHGEESPNYKDSVEMISTDEGVSSTFVSTATSRSSKITTETPLTDLPLASITSFDGTGDEDTPMQGDEVVEGAANGEAMQATTQAHDAEEDTTQTDHFQGEEGVEPPANSRRKPHHSSAWIEMIRAMSGDREQVGVPARRTGRVGDLADGESMTALFGVHLSEEGFMRQGPRDDGGDFQPDAVDTTLEFVRGNFQGEVLGAATDFNRRMDHDVAATMDQIARRVEGMNEVTGSFEELPRSVNTGYNKLARNRAFKRSGSLLRVVDTRSYAVSRAEASYLEDYLSCPSPCNFSGYMLTPIGGSVKNSPSKHIREGVNTHTTMPSYLDIGFGLVVVYEIGRLSYIPPWNTPHWLRAPNWIPCIQPSMIAVFPTLPGGDDDAEASRKEHYTKLFQQHHNGALSKGM
jgi:hypothetical protein